MPRLQQSKGSVIKRFVCKSKININCIELSVSYFLLVSQTQVWQGVAVMARCYSDDNAATNGLISHAIITLLHR